MQRSRNTFLFYGFSDSNKTRWNPSSHEHQSFWMAPFLENRNGQAINQSNPAATTLKRRLQCKRSSTQSSSKISSLDIFCLFSAFSSTIEHSFTKRGRKGAVLHSQLANNYTRPMGLRNHSELQNRTDGTPLAVQNPFLLPIMSQTCLTVFWEKK